MKQNFRLLLFYLLMPVGVMLVSCNQSVDSTAVNTDVPQVYKNNDLQQLAVNNETLKFKNDGGTEAFSFKIETNGAKLIDANDKELARLTVDEKQKVKIKNVDDQVLGYVVAKDGRWKIENADQTQELYILRRQNDGDYKLEDGADKEIYRIKMREYGFEIESPTKESLYKVKVKDGKISLRDKSDKTVLYTKSQLTPIAIACFGFDVLTQEQQAALAYAVNLTGG